MCHVSGLQWQCWLSNIYIDIQVNDIRMWRSRKLSFLEMRIARNLNVLLTKPPRTALGLWHFLHYEKTPAFHYSGHVKSGLGPCGQMWTIFILVQ